MIGATSTMRMDAGDGTREDINGILNSDLLNKQFA